jgi:hypothetical protein
MTNENALPALTQAPSNSFAINPGDIFQSSWGYDQTNRDFYQVIKVTTQAATLQKLQTRQISGDGWGGSVIPLKDEFSPHAKAFRRKIQRLCIETGC